MTMMYLASNISEVRQESLQKFKTRFVKDFNTFILKFNQANPNWDPTSYCLQAYSLRGKFPRLSFKSEKLLPERVYFMMHEIPTGIGLTDRIELLDWIKLCCTKQGFLIKSSIESRLELITKVLELDNQAWHIWVNRNYDKWIKYAERGLVSIEKKGIRVILEPEDIVESVLMRIKKIIEEKKVRTDLGGLVGIEILKLINKIKYRKRLDGVSIRLQSNSKVVNDRSRRKWHEALVIPRVSSLISQKQIDCLISATKLELTMTQAKVLRAIVDNHNQFKNNCDGKYYVLNNIEIAKLIGLTNSSKPLTKERIAQLLNRLQTKGGSSKSIALKLIENARRLANDDIEYAPLHKYLEYLSHSGKHCVYGRYV